MKKILLLLILILLTACASLEKVNKNDKKYSSKGYVDIRGDKQYIDISTSNIDKPVLLYLHGGPGGPLTPLMRLLFEELEKDFIVVLWDQRGAGKSFHGFISSKYQTIDSFVEDTKEVTNYLLKKFDKKKIYLVGNSWGSLLGIKTIKKYPNLYYAFIGTGQAVDVPNNMKISYDLLLKNSIETKNIKLEKKLRKLNREKLDVEITFTNFFTLRKYIKIINELEEKNAEEVFKERILEKDKNANVELESKKAYKKARSALTLAYKPFVINLEMAYLFRKLRKEMLKVNLKKEVTKVDIPVYFAIGKKDYTTPYILAQEYFNILEAPKKELIWFEKSGHGPEVTELKKFSELLNRIKEETYK